MKLAPPRGAFGTPPSRGRHQRLRLCRAAVALENTARLPAAMFGAMENQDG